MKKQTLIKALIVLGLGMQVSGLTPSFVSRCYAQAPAIGKPWVGMGGKFQKGLSVLSSGSSITVLGVGTDNALWTIRSEDKGKSWGGFIGHGDDNVRTAPACDYDKDDQGLANDTTRFRCFWVYGGSLYSRLVTASGTGDEPYIRIDEKNLTPNPPSVVGRMVFAHGYQVWVVGTVEGKLSDGWDSRGGKLKWGPSCVSDGSYHDNRDKPNTSRPLFSCYAVGTDDAVWVESHDLKYSLQSDEYHNVWKRVGGLAVGGVNAWSYGNSSVGTLLAVRGTDSTLWLGRYDWQHPQNGWLWKDYPGEISSVPACISVSWAVGSTTGNYCFAILPDGQLGFLDLGRL
jgi:hypothetical protein